MEAGRGAADVAGSAAAGRDGWGVGEVALLLGLLLRACGVGGRIPHASSTLSADDSTSCAPQRVRVSEGVRERERESSARACLQEKL